MIRTFVTSKNADLEATKADLLATNARLDAQDVLIALKAPISNPTILTTAVLPADTTIGTVSAADILTLVNVTSDIQAQLDAKAPLASPTLTGVPAAPTAATATNTTQLATTAFVQQELTSGAGALAENAMLLQFAAAHG